MTKTKSSYGYYKIDTGFFPDVMKLCFDEESFQDALRDHHHSHTIKPFEVGFCETHYFNTGTQQNIFLAFSPEVFDFEAAEVVGFIAHEISHAVDQMETVIGDEIDGEIRAYLTQHLVTQCVQIFNFEREKRVGKTSRIAVKQTRKGSRRSNVQVDKLGKRGAGSDCDSKLQGFLRGIEDAERGAFGEAKAGVQPDKPARSRRVRSKEL